MEVTSPMPVAAPAAVLPRRQVLIVFSGIMLGLLLAAIDQTIVATALPTIIGELGGLDHLAWVVTAYLLTETVSTPLRQAQRPLRPQAPVPVGDRRVPHRQRPVRARHADGHAHHLPRSRASVPAA